MLASAGDVIVREYGMNLYVTRSDKTNLIALVSSFDFSSQTQRHKNKLLNFTFTIQWSPFPGCFSKHGDDPYKQSRMWMLSWPACRCL